MEPTILANLEEQPYEKERRERDVLREGHALLVTRVPRTGFFFLARIKFSQISSKITLQVPMHYQFFKLQPKAAMRRAKPCWPGSNVIKTTEQRKLEK